MDRELDTVSWFRQTAPLAFERTELGGAGITDFPVAVAVADLDGDGRSDFVVANAHGLDLALFFQLPGGDFPSVPDLRLDSPEVRPTELAVADLDGDGDQDVLVTDSGLDLFTAVVGYRQTEPGVFVADPQLSFRDPESIRLAVDLGTEDVDADGDIDIVSANLTSGNYSLFENRDQQYSGRADVLVSSLGESGGAVSVAVADVDGRGGLDATGAALSNSLSTYLSALPGNYNDQPASLLGGQFLSPGPRMRATGSWSPPMSAKGCRCRVPQDASLERICHGVLTMAIGVGLGAALLPPSSLEAQVTPGEGSRSRRLIERAGARSSGSARVGC